MSHCFSDNPHCLWQILVSRQASLGEGIAADRSLVAVNTVIDALRTAADQDQGRRSLLAFSRDEEARAECGRRARVLAERDFDINKYQTFLYAELSDLAQRAESSGRPSRTALAAAEDPMR